MDLTHSPEDLAFCARTRRWLEEHAPRHALRTLAERKAWHRELYAAGYVGMGWPRAYGGQDASVIQQAIVVDEMARVNAPPPINDLGIGVVGPTLLAHGTERQKERYLRNILTAHEIWCQLYSEPDAGSDLASLKTRATDEGDVFVVDGQKVWTSDGPVADRGLLLARTNPAGPKHHGISCFLIDMRQPGIAVRPLRQITGGEEFSEVFLTRAGVAKEDLVGRLGQGWEIARTTLASERGATALARITGYRAAVNELLTAARRLRRDGRALIEHPAVRINLGRIVAEVEVQRYAALRMLSAMQQTPGTGPHPSIVKLSYSEFEKRLFDLALEILGPYGQLVAEGREGLDSRIVTYSGHGTTWAYAYLWSRAGTIYAGSSEIQKNVIADRVLELPRLSRAGRLPDAGRGVAG
jgi:alkylation response protein AidB-like acyl-CoA dehydrogenase